MVDSLDMFGPKAKITKMGDPFTLRGRQDPPWLPTLPGLPPPPARIGRSGEPPAPYRPGTFSYLRTDEEPDLPPVLPDPLPLRAAADPPPMEDPEPRAAAKVKLAKRLLEDGQADDGRQFLRDVARRFPQTRAAEEARQLLRAAGEDPPLSARAAPAAPPVAPPPPRLEGRAR